MNNQTSFTDPDNIKAGLSKSIVSTVVSTIAFIFSYFAIIFILWDVAVSIVFAILSLPLSGIALVWGIQSIKTFKQRCKTKCRKPIPTLILGINGVATAGASMIFSTIGLILALIYASL